MLAPARGGAATLEREETGEPHSSTLRARVTSAMTPSHFSSSVGGPWCWERYLASWRWPVSWPSASPTFSLTLIAFTRRPRCSTDTCASSSFRRDLQNLLKVPIVRICGRASMRSCRRLGAYSPLALARMCHSRWIPLLVMRHPEGGWGAARCPRLLHRTRMQNWTEIFAPTFAAYEAGGAQRAARPLIFWCQDRWWFWTNHQEPAAFPAVFDPADSLPVPRRS